MKHFIFESKNIPRDSAVWNMIASMMNAFQSVVLLIILSYTVGSEIAGIYTIGNVNANLFVNLGKYGVRNYQVSDVKNRFSFGDYHLARLVSSVLMIVLSAAYTFYYALSTGYSTFKLWTVIFLCLQKVPDAYEDVFHGDYQKKDRLDIASKCLAIRLFVTILVFILMIVFTKNILLASIVSTAVSFVIMICLIIMTEKYFGTKGRFSNSGFSKMVELLCVTFPLCAGMFLVNYIGAAPKASIDSYMPEKYQAIYGYISLPVFVISLLTTVIFNPMIHKISVMWDEEKTAEVKKTIFRLCLSAAVITVVSIGGAALLGIPVLSLMYNIDLSAYKTDLQLLLVGGGFLALTSIFTMILTVMRGQKSILIGYTVVSLAMLFISDEVVKRYQIRGAVYIYMAALAVLSIIFGISMMIKLEMKGRQRQE